MWPTNEYNLNSDSLYMPQCHPALAAPLCFHSISYKSKHNLFSPSLQPKFQKDRDHVKLSSPGPQNLAHICIAHSRHSVHLLNGGLIKKLSYNTHSSLHLLLTATSITTARVFLNQTIEVDSSLIKNPSLASHYP